MYKNIFFDNLIFKEARKNLRDRFRFKLVGSAPIEGKIINFLRFALLVEFFRGYGQTEDVACALLCNICDPITNYLDGPGYLILVTQ